MLTAALALGALPGLAGSHEPSPASDVEAGAFRQVNLATARDPQAIGDLVPDPAGRSNGALVAGDRIVDLAPGGLPASPGERTVGTPQAPGATWAWKKPRLSLTGAASFYDHGTTAMRDVPPGTTIVICGAGGCIQTVVSDYGPARSTGRIIDMYRPDFFKVCGCGWWSGTTEVTVRVY